VAALAGAGLAGALVAAGVMWFARPTRVVEEPPTEAARAVTSASFAAAPSLPAQDLAERMATSLVQVDASHGGSWTSGTGIRLDADGTIAVATPVVDGAVEVMVTGHDGARLRATTGGADAATGITVLSVSEGGGAVFDADPATAAAGEPVTVIGAGVPSEAGAAPLVWTAAISATDVRATVAPFVLHDAVQLDRAVPPGATGGLVVDAAGDLVGIVLAGSGAEDLAVVVPAADAIAAARGLRDDGAVRRAWLGVRAVDLSPSAAQLMGVEGGAQLTSVQAGSPASAVGMRKGDVIVGVDDRGVRDASDLVVALRDRKPGEEVVVRWHRGAASGETGVTLGG
jgi:S1-C subfamily serine protease